MDEADVKEMLEDAKVLAVARATPLTAPEAQPMQPKEVAGELIVNGGNFLATALPLAGGDPVYLALLQGMIDLHVKKAADYGSDDDPLANLRGSLDIGIQPSVGAWLRAKDKVRRIDRYFKKRKLANESVDDSLRDLAAYSLLTLRLLMEERDADQDKSGRAAPT